MAGTSIKKGKAGNKGELVIRFTVAECGEIHSGGNTMKISKRPRKPPLFTGISRQSAGMASQPSVLSYTGGAAAI